MKHIDNFDKINIFEPAEIYSHSEILKFDINTLSLTIDQKIMEAVEFDEIRFYINTDNIIDTNVVDNFKKNITDGKLIILLNYEPISIFNFGFLMKLNNVIVNNDMLVIKIPSDWTIGKIFTHCTIKTNLTVTIENLSNITGVELVIKRFDTDLSNKDFLFCVKPITQLKEVINYEHTNNTDNTDNTDTTHTQKFYLDDISFAKGYIIEGDISKIDRFVIRINGLDRFESWDNTLLQTLCYKISDNLHYFSYVNKNNLKDLSFDSYAGAINYSAIDYANMILSLKNFDVEEKLKIYSVGLNCIIYTGHAPFDNYRFIGKSIVYTPMYRIIKDKFWCTMTLVPKNINIKRKLETEKEICPITYQLIESEYYLCDKCSNAFDYNSINKWLSKNNTCPMCRSVWVSDLKFTKI